MPNIEKNDKTRLVLLNLGATIKRLRLEKGWTQEKLAEKSHINDKEVSHIEAGRRNITIETLVKIASALSIKPENLIRS